MLVFRRKNYNFDYLKSTFILFYYEEIFTFSFRAFDGKRSLCTALRA